MEDRLLVGKEYGKKEIKIMLLLKSPTGPWAKEMRI